MNAGWLPPLAVLMIAASSIVGFALSRAHAEDPTVPRQAEGSRQLPRPDVGRSVFNDDDSLFLSTHDGAVCVWRCDTKQVVTRVVAPDFYVRRAVFSPDGSVIAAVNGESVPAQVRLLNAATGKELRRWTVSLGPLGGIGFSPDGSRLLVLHRQDESAHMLDVATGKELFSVPVFWARSGCPLDFSADSRWICTRAEEGAIVWDAVTGEKRCYCRSVPNGPTEPASVLGEPRLNAQGAVVAASGRSIDGGVAVNLYDARDGRLLRGLSVAGYRIHHEVAFSPDGRRVAVGANDEMQAEPDGAAVLVWDVASGKLIKKLKSSGRPARIDFSPDGSQVHSLGWTKVDGEKVSRTYCWDIESGTELGVDMTGAYNRSGTLLVRWIARTPEFIDVKASIPLREAR